MLETLQNASYKFDSFSEFSDRLQYLDWFKNNHEFKTVNVTPDVALKFKGKLYGLFREVGIDPRVYLYTMYINGYNSPVDYNGDRLTFSVGINPNIPK